jgi:hypothetical protein
MSLAMMSAERPRAAPDAIHSVAESSAAVAPKHACLVSNTRHRLGSPSRPCTYDDTGFE